MTAPNLSNINVSPIQWNHPQSAAFNLKLLKVALGFSGPFWPGQLSPVVLTSSHVCLQLTKIPSLRTPWDVMLATSGLVCELEAKYLRIHMCNIYTLVSPGTHLAQSQFFYHMKYDL